jgi:hypothetical protein
MIYEQCLARKHICVGYTCKAARVRGNTRVGWVGGGIRMEASVMLGNRHVYTYVLGFSIAGGIW